MSQITTHILDTALGEPAQGIVVSLHRQAGSGWVEMGAGKTNEDGRYGELCSSDEVLEEGLYRMQFATSEYFKRIHSPVFYPWVDVVFHVEGDGRHYHIPLLLSPYGYSTYRGS
ncbi:hydroxyisourate hydrolase [Porticoccus sp. W117]|uniref:hydroxyisourate hydrolase n=1 Tax=Porticoccus sp. W117 TaxID=3054777 RepID=UPI0025929871|nr:hydroxyisourate hydrolase [Porticoccus sp. W117]MDM3872333.1 hydroxyisourate hydrolase [Porticoccus sp. W117]